MDNGWQKYERRNAHLPADVVSIAPNGVLVFGKSIYAQLGSPTAVALYYHAQRSAIGIAPAGDDEPNRLVVSKAGTKTRNLWRINIIRFLDYHAIPHEKRERYPAAIEQNGSGPMLVIELGGDK